MLKLKFFISSMLVNHNTSHATLLQRFSSKNILIIEQFMHFHPIKIHRPSSSTQCAHCTSIFLWENWKFSSHTAAPEAYTGFWFFRFRGRKVVETFWWPKDEKILKEMRLRTKKDLQFLQWAIEKIDSKTRTPLDKGRASVPCPSLVHAYTFVLFLGPPSKFPMSPPISCTPLLTIILSTLLFTWWYKSLSRLKWLIDEFLNDLKWLVYFSPTMQCTILKWLIYFAQQNLSHN